MLPVENQALMDISNRSLAAHEQKKADASLVQQDRSRRPFEAMNTLAAHLLTHLTSSMRYHGDLNIDLNEITTNLVPFPRMHFLTSSLCPVYTARSSKPFVDDRYEYDLRM